MTVEEYFQNRSSDALVATNELFFGAFRPVPTPTETQLVLFANLAISLGKQLRTTAYQIQTDQVRILHEASQSVRACGACINYGMPSYHPLDLQRSAFRNPIGIFDFPRSESVISSLLKDFHATYAHLHELLCYGWILQCKKRIILQLRATPQDDWETCELNEPYDELPLPFAEAYLNLNEIFEGLKFEEI